MSPTLLEKPKLFRHLVENLPVGIYIVDRERKILFWNHGAEHITGRLSHEVVGHVLEDVVHACDRHGNPFAGALRPVTVTINQRLSQSCTAFFLHRDGHRVPVDVRIRPIAEPTEAVEGAVVLFEEVFAYRDEAAGPQMYGCLDSITRIPSRTLTEALLDRCITVMETSGVAFGLLQIRLIGLDEFRAKHGPQSIVPFLRTAARTLRHSLNTEYFLGCWQEHEFLALLPSAGPIAVAATAETLWNLLNKSEIAWWGDRFIIDSEVTCTMATPGKTLEALLEEMRPSHSSRARKAVATGVGGDAQG